MVLDYEGYRITEIQYIYYFALISDFISEKACGSSQ